jgi:acyl-CoA thioester hydrolase
MITRNEPYIVKVFIEDTDIGGLVYHANYLKYLERARSMLLYHKGITHAQLRENKKLMFVLKSCNIVYEKPAYLEDELFVYTEPELLSGARLKMKQSIVRGQDLLVKADMVLACVTLEGRPVRVPPFIASALNIG